MVKGLRYGMLSAAVGLLLVVACSKDENERTIGGETNWFSDCETDDDCTGDLSCHRSKCTRTCSDDDACREAPGASCDGTVCVEASQSCLPLPCPDGAPWNASTCSCGSTVDSSTVACALSAPVDPVTQTCGVAAVVDPPSYCVAPCVWEMVKRCLPVKGACEVATHPGGTTYCQTDTQWSVEQVVAMGVDHSATVSIATSLGACYSGGGGWLSKGMTYVRYFNGDQAIQVNDGPVVCASIATLNERGILPTDTEFPPDIVTYALDRARPECADWDEYGVPKTPCEATAGDCGLGN